MPEPAAHGRGGAPAPRLADDGRDPELVPEDWRELVDPAEWRLNAEGLPARRAARCVVLRSDPEPGILLVTGHDFGDEQHWWAFTPGGGILGGESSRDAAVRELCEETGIDVAPARLDGPIALRSSRFFFHLVTCRQDEEMYLLRLGPDESGAHEGADGEMDRSGWTEQEHEVLDSLRWWPLDELEARVADGMTVYPRRLPGMARALLHGWDGTVVEILEED